MVCSARKLWPVISTKCAPWVRRSRAADASRGSPKRSGHSARSIRGQKDRAALIALVDDIVEILGPGRAQRLEPEVVEDEEIGAGIASEAGLARPVGATAGEVGEHLVSGDEEDLVAAAAGLVGESLRKVALAHAGRAIYENALVARDELAGGESKT